MRLTATVPSGMVSDDQIRFLVIESDENDSKGYFLFLHQELNKPCEADYWFISIEAAKSQAFLDYGVEIDSWQ